VSETLEILGLLCLAAFCYILWPPLALIPIGLGLIVAGIALDGVKVTGWRRDESD
jgi:hypothetical protein